MSHRARQDVPGSWHHVMNRGIARRTTFETRRDMRFFLSRLAWAVRRYEVEIHAYSLLTTHFHLLVRSVRGNLSNAIGWVENQYVRWFNRSRQRDGSLFRGRFTSRPVSTDAYWRVLVRYIDLNAVSAGLARNPFEYAFCSARDYGRRRGPRWLTRTAVEEVVRSSMGLQSYEPHVYERVFQPDLQPSVKWLPWRMVRPPACRSPTRSPRSRWLEGSKWTRQIGRSKTEGEASPGGFCYGSESCATHAVFGSMRSPVDCRYLLPGCIA